MTIGRNLTTLILYIVNKNRNTNSKEFYLVGMIPISVLLPAYNAELFIEQSITSILKQTFLDFEFIIINDGSTDRTEEIIRGFSDHRIRYFDNLKNCGLIYTLNRGIELANGKYIARMDADDISLPKRFEKQFAYLENHPNCAVLGTAYLPVDLDNNPVMKPVESPIWAKMSEWFMVIGCPVAHPSVMYRTNLARRANGYNPRFLHAEDYEFWTRMIKLGDICSLPEALLRYRTGNSNRVSEKFFLDQHEISIEIRQNYFLDHFGNQLPFLVSRAIQDIGGNITNSLKNETCYYLLSAYKKIIDKGNITRVEKESLDSLVYNYLQYFSKQITEREFTIKISKNPISIRPLSGLCGLLIATFQKVKIMIKKGLKNLISFCFF